MDHNGKSDLILVTSDATSSGESLLTLILSDDFGRPVPWQAYGFFEPSRAGLENLVDLQQDGRAELLYVEREGSGRGGTQRSRIDLYTTASAHLRQHSGRAGAENFPIVRPVGSKVIRGTDLTSDPVGKLTFTIRSIVEADPKQCDDSFSVVTLPSENVSHS